MRNDSSPLDGQRLLEQGFRPIDEVGGPVLKAPSGERFEWHEYVKVGIYTYQAIEVSQTIERECPFIAEARAELAKRKASRTGDSLAKRKSNRTGDRLGIKGRTLTTQPVRNRFI